MRCSTRSRVLWLMSLWLRNAFETVIRETPRSCAISFIRTAILYRYSMAVRMKDIAQDLGVSLMTVSKALRNHSDISHKTRERVLQRMRELNYQPDWIARSMVTRRTYLVGLVLPDLMHSFFAEVAKGVARTLQPLGYQVVISNTEEDGEIEQKQIDVLAMRKVDGLIIASAQRDTKVFETLAQRKIPYVLMDRTIQGVDANYVGVKDRSEEHTSELQSRLH